MTDPKRLEALLEELYAIEPELRAQEVALRRLATELLASKPDAPVDDRFVERLRGELLTRASSHTRFSFMNLFSLKHRLLVPGLAALVLVVAAGVTFQHFMPGRGTPSRVASIERVQANAFGRLGYSVNDPSGIGAGGNTAVRASATSAESASPLPALTAPALPPMPGGMGTGDNAKMIAPDWIPTVYRYTYVGDPIENLPSQVDVYRRMKAVPSIGPLAALKDQNLGLVDLGKVKDGFVQSFSIAETRENGYVFNIDPQEGMVGIFQNAKWISPLSRCLDQSCYEQNRLKESDLLPDEEVIRTADAFLDEYGISKAGYSAPVVNNQWRVQYAAMDAAARSSFWFPDSVSVVYPVLVDGKAVYDESGNPYGLNVNVDVRSKRVQSVWNLFTSTYQVSSYAAEMDTKRLIGIAERTDNFYAADAIPENAKTITVELGTPTIVYTRSWQMIGDTGAELLVPALVFPLKNRPAELWRTQVIVPLAKDLLVDPDTTINHPLPVDVPVMAEPSVVKEIR